jgi:ABC-type glycerol-3-phosphate transport system permease component
VEVPTFLVRGDVYFWGSLMAACFIASVPIAIVYNFFRRPLHRRLHRGRDQVTRITRSARRYGVETCLAG